MVILPSKFWNWWQISRGARRSIFTSLPCPQRSGWKCKQCEKENGKMYPQEVAPTWRSHHEKTNHRLMPNGLSKKHKGGGGRVKAPTFFFLIQVTLAFYNILHYFFKRGFQACGKQANCFKTPAWQIQFASVLQMFAKDNKADCWRCPVLLPPWRSLEPRGLCRVTNKWAAGKGRGIYISRKQLGSRLADFREPWLPLPRGIVLLAIFTEFLQSSNISVTVRTQKRVLRRIYGKRSRIQNRGPHVPCSNSTRFVAAIVYFKKVNNLASWCRAPLARRPPHFPLTPTSS